MNPLLFQSAVRAQGAGQFAEAAKICHEILGSDPKHFGALYMLGMLHLQAGRPEEAQFLIGEAVKLQPKSADAWCNRGVALQRLKRDAEALLCFENALRLKPAYIPALINRSGALLALFRFDETLEACEQVLAIDPGNTDGWNNRGFALVKLRRHAEALAAYERVTALEPEFAEGWSNRGFELNRLGRFAEALAVFDNFQHFKPATAAVLLNRGIALAGLKHYAEAAAAFEAALAADPQLPYMAGELAINRFHCCDWRHAVADRAALSDGVRAGRPVADPQIMQMLGSSPEEQLQCAQMFSAREFPPAATPLWQGTAYAHDKIRLAYLSADFHQHATAFLMAGLFERHDRTRFETLAISFGPDDQSAMRARLIGAFGEFLDVRDKSDTEVAALLRRREIDIAIDLKAYTSGARPGILPLRPAPIQVNYLGYPGTMGAAHIDYLIADRMLIGADEEKFYSEAIVLLPDCYQPTDAARAMAARAPSRAEEGLPEQGFVFASFNNPYKLNPEIFDVWMRLLQAVPGSVLWQWSDYPVAGNNLRREAEARGIAAERIVLARFARQEEHLARQRLADLFLDTLPYNAHTTASDALWAGLPLLTCKGSSFAGRVAASILTAAGLPELIADNLDDYESLALRYARDGAALGALKAKLAANRLTASLFDTDRYRRHLEAAFIAMQQRRQQNLPPAGIIVPAMG